MVTREVRGMMTIKFRYRVKNRETGKTITAILSIQEIENQGFVPEIFKGFDWEILSRDQFTGLFDKNGKEIFEGDVVKRTCRQWCCGKVTYETVGVVEWFGEGWSLKESDGSYTGWANQKHEDIEIIGNIYEHPELLKATA
jgi:uncharacterized phage protein (TIGR01671 family)